MIVFAAAYLFAVYPLGPSSEKNRASFGLSVFEPFRRHCCPWSLKAQDTIDRCLPPYRTACTRTSCVPGSLAPLARWGRHEESAALHGLPGESSGSRHSRPLRRIVPLRAVASLTSDARRRAWACSSHGAWGNRASDAPVASVMTRLPNTFVYESPVGFPWEASRGERASHHLPRPSSEPARESRLFVKVRSIFHRQGLLVGSGGVSPRARERDTAIGDGTPAGCRYLDILSLSSGHNRNNGHARLAIRPFENRPRLRETRVRNRCSRPPYTQPWPLFLERVC